ncbi:hypothetical protein POVCU2_0002250 [Plasmodium ovale curtisi]|uniref:Uncharacterized protein n=1 Tax=Plasmodium ovale curtisi TaxID=864141 RepID=A0A1A8VLB1_PLAOA|nr:hypothetical protein POVCU2_0002250 [Plasmodium ovale curtisi]
MKRHIAKKKAEQKGSINTSKWSSKRMNSPPSCSNYTYCKILEGIAVRDTSSTFHEKFPLQNVKFYHSSFMNSAEEIPERFSSDDDLLTKTPSNLYFSFKQKLIGFVIGSAAARAATKVPFS